VRILKFLPALIAIASSAVAQTPAPKAQTTATVFGTVFDSVRNRPMTGAIIRVDSSAIIGVSDASGHFRIDSIPAGQHYLKVEHPVLDTMGVALRSPVEPYAAGDIRAVELATPTEESLIAIFCASAWRARGPAVLVGRVRDADTGEPAVGAKVSLVWYELDIQAGVKRVPRVRESNAGADGTFRICGLPAKLDGKVQVIRGALTSGEILVSFGDDLFFMRNMSIAAPGAIVAIGIDSSARQSSDSGARRKAPVVTMLGTARLTGRVLNKLGQPLNGARVSLDGSNRVAVTRNGEFALDSLPAGTQNVTARLLGYAPSDAAVDLVSRDTRSVTITMPEFVPVLNTVRVTAQRERALDDVGFSQRKRTGQGYYLDDKQINHNTLNFSDAMRVVPGIRVVPYNGKNVIASQRDPNGCVNFFVDGVQWTTMEPGDIDDFVRPYELAAVEVYNASTTPSQFQVTGQTGCLTVVAWTYRRLDKKK